MDEALLRRFSDLDIAIRDVSSNIACVSYRPPRGVDVFYTGGATRQEQNAVDAVVAAFDWTPRSKKSLGQLRTEIEALSNADRNKLVAAVLGEFLRDHPRFAERLGISLSGDS